MWQVHAHIEEVGMPLSSVVTPWFMCLFINILPLEVQLLCRTVRCAPVRFEAKAAAMLTSATVHSAFL